MKVRLTTGRADGEGNSWEPGDEIEVPDDEAKRLLESGSAEPIAKRKRDLAETR